MMVFSNKTARDIFLLLVFATIAILISFTFITTQTHKLFLHRINAQKQFARVLTTALKENRSKLFIKKPGVRARISSKPLINSKKIVNLRYRAVPKYILTAKKAKRVSIKIADKKWLNIMFLPMRQPFWGMVIGYGITVLILISILIMLYYFSVKRLITPVVELQNIAEKNIIGGGSMQPLPKTTSMELNKIIDAINKMQQRIQKLLNKRTQMLAAISHDLRTPLTRLKLRSEYLEDSPHYNKIVADLLEMEQMLASVIAFTRDDAYDEVVEKFDLEALVESVCNDMSDSGLNVSFSGTAEIVPFYGKISSLRRVFSNLISNAVKYGNLAKVKLSCSNDLVKIEVEDNGAGIPEDELDKVFDPFYRLDKSRSKKTGGTGLGLAIVRDIVRSHEGDVVLKILRGGGLLASVVFPLKMHKK